jgi:hypothetical protein
VVVRKPLYEKKKKKKKKEKKRKRKEKKIVRIVQKLCKSCARNITLPIISKKSEYIIAHQK